MVPTLLNCKKSVIPWQEVSPELVLQRLFGGVIRGAFALCLYTCALCPRKGGKLHCSFDSPSQVNHMWFRGPLRNLRGRLWQTRLVYTLRV